MKNTGKIFGNIILFIVYTLAGITLVNTLFGLVLSVMDQPIPGPDDLVHVKMAVITLVFVTVVTVLYRKYFYMKVEGFKKTEK
jgi:hypothetical protein